MKVYKFGGASVKDFSSVKNLGTIVAKEKSPLVVVVSAMGKTTNALEELCQLYFEKNSTLFSKYDSIINFHREIARGLDLTLDDYGLVANLIYSLKTKLGKDPSLNYNFEYDQIVSYGELLSTAIITEYLNAININSQWVDIRKALKTNESYRDAKIDFELSSEFVPKYFNGTSIKITQGFIGSASNNLTTTLGREGSDYSAALLAYFLNSESVTVWKDVDGVLNADPKWFDETVKLDKISYEDAIELAFYGASVIHPKTIQPLQEKGISLFVRSFIHTTSHGTHIGNVDYKKLIPSFIFKVNEVLIDIHSKDLSFITEEGMQQIFKVFAKYKVRINLMQNTAVSFRICATNDENRLTNIISELSSAFKVTVEKGLELITIRYYDRETIDRVLVQKEVLLEQKTKDTIQMVVRPQ